MKTLIVLPHLKTEYFEQDKNGELEFKFFDSQDGKLLRKLITSKRTGLDLNPKELSIKFLAKTIPNKNKFGYTQPKVDYLRQGTEEIKQFVVENNVDLVLAFGALSKAWLVGKSAKTYQINDTILDYDGDKYNVKIACYPILKPSKFYGGNERNSILILNRLVRRYLAGDTELKAVLGNYEYVTNFDRVVDIFENVLPKYPIIAVDFETNTLETYRKGAKALCVSLSWKEEQGVTIPLYHKDNHYFNDEQKEKIIEYINKLMMSKQPKVFHNANYDVSMLMNIYGLEYVTNVYDTLIMYYLAVDEDPVTTKTLKRLASVYTSMNDYEHDRDVAFEEYLKHDYEVWEQSEKERIQKELEEYNKAKAEGKSVTKPSTKVYKSHYTEPTNKIDGSKTDFEWLPVDVLSEYASADTDATLRLFHILSKKIEKRSSWKNLAYNFYPKLLDTLAYMEAQGIQFNMEKAKLYHNEYHKMLDDLETRIYAETPDIREIEHDRLALYAKRSAIMKNVKAKDRTPEQQEIIKKGLKYTGNRSDGTPKTKFSLTSRKDLQELFFVRLGYHVPLEKGYVIDSALQKRIPKEELKPEHFKTDKNVLSYLAKTYNDKTAKDLLLYSELQKAINSFIDALPDLTDEKGRIHTVFHMTSVRTGRLSSSNPKIKLGL